MDSKQPHSGKLQKLYHLYSVIKLNAHNDIKDGKDFLTFLRVELDAKDENVVPLKNEIMYFADFLSQAQGGHTQDSSLTQAQ